MELERKIPVLGRSEAEKYILPGIGVGRTNGGAAVLPGIIVPIPAGVVRGDSKRKVQVDRRGTTPALLGSEPDGETAAEKNDKNSCCRIRLVREHNLILQAQSYTFEADLLKKGRR